MQITFASALLAQVQQARAAQAEAETKLGYTNIFAPVDGVISLVAALEGETVQTGVPIITIIDINHLWVRADVEESYIDSIQYGQILRIRLPSNDVVEGRVIFKGVDSEYATQRDVSRTKRDIKTFAIKLQVPDAHRRLSVGMTATVLLRTEPLREGIGEADKSSFQHSRAGLFRKLSEQITSCTLRLSNANCKRLDSR